jgi:hypothetical protein
MPCKHGVHQVTGTVFVVSAALDLAAGRGQRNQEKAVETADATDDADRQGLELKRPRTFKVTPEPSMDWLVQPLPLRHRRHLRFNELPFSGSNSIAIHVVGGHPRQTL